MSPSSSASTNATGRPHFQDELRELEAAARSAAIDIVLEQLDRTLEALAHQDVELAAIVIADDDRVDGRYLEVHQGILSLLARQAPGRRRPAPRRRAAARDRARRAHGRPVREHLQADAAVGPRAADAARDPRAAAADGRARALRGLAGQALVRGPRRRARRGSRAPGPRGQPDPARDLPHGDRGRRRHRHARVGDAHDARRALRSSGSATTPSTSASRRRSSSRACSASSRTSHRTPAAVARAAATLAGCEHPVTAGTALGQPPRGPTRISAR